MDLKKTGAFLAASRKKQKMTQKELAEEIGVTDKAVSRWETGRGFPDVSVLQPLAQALGVSVAEIVKGEKIEPENAGEQADSAVVEALGYAGRMGRKTFGALTALLGACIAASPLVLAVRGPLLPEICLLGIAITAVGALLFFGRAPGRPFRFSTRLAGVLACAALTAALVLEATPWGAVLIFAPGPGETVRETFSYFSLTPFGYANFFPLLTAVLTVSAGGLSIFLLAKRLRTAKLQNVAFLCTAAALLCSAAPVVLLGAAYGSATGAAISILLLASLVFQAFANRRSGV